MIYQLIYHCEKNGVIIEHSIRYSNNKQSAIDYCTNSTKKELCIIEKNNVIYIYCVDDKGLYYYITKHTI